MQLQQFLFERVRVGTEWTPETFAALRFAALIVVPATTS